jgi:hypothetical protein
LTHNIGRVSFSCQSPIMCRRPGRPQSGSERFGEDMNFLPLPVIEPWFLGCPPRSLVTVLTELPGFLCLLSLKTITGRKLGQVSRSPCRGLNPCLSEYKSRLAAGRKSALWLSDLRHLRYLGHCFIWQLPSGTARRYCCRMSALLECGERTAGGCRVILTCVCVATFHINCMVLCNP